MKLCLITIVVVIVGICDGRVATQTGRQTGRSVDRSAGVSSTGGARSATSATSATGVSGGSGGQSNGGHAQGPPAQAQIKPLPFSPCRPHPCFQFQIKEKHYPVYEKRLISAGKWLKVNRKLFDPTLDDQYKEMNDFITGRMPYAVPAVLQLDVPADFVSRYPSYKSEMERIDLQLRQTTRTIYQAVTQQAAQQDRKKLLHLRTQFNTTKNEAISKAKTAYNTYMKNIYVTVFNYLNPVYQKDPTKPNDPPLKEPPPPTSANINIVDEPDMLVYVKGYGASGLAGAPEHLYQLANAINQTSLTTFWFANYANNFYEVYVNADSTKGIFI